MLGSLGAGTLRINPAYAAAAALVVIQVSIGVLFKIAQTGGQYSFSASSSVTISEFLKFLLASVFFYRECVRKHASDPPRLVETRPSLDEEKQISSDEGEDQAFLKNAEKVAHRIGTFRPAFMRMDLKTLYGYALDELPIDARYGFAMLALFYVLINNTVTMRPST